MTEQAANTRDHIIVVDDDITNLKMTGAILRNRGIRTTLLKSGKELIASMDKGIRGDLILLDILMPEMDGFQTYEALRAYEMDHSLTETPVIFLTGDNSREKETLGFSMGALDFVRKPFEAEVLIHRIKNILRNTRRIHTLSEKAATDQLTGFYNKSGITRRLEEECIENPGTLLMVDLDNFKPINDIYGHKAGDRVLTAFADLLRKNLRSRDITGRIGGDEFVVYMRDNLSRGSAVRITGQLNEDLLKAVKELLGDDMPVPIGVSVGAVISKKRCEYKELLEKADQALMYVKRNGKHACKIWEEDGFILSPSDQIDSLNKLNMILDERAVQHHAMWIGPETFVEIYHYILRFIRRYHENAYKALFTMFPENGEMSEAEFSDKMAEFGECIRNSLRNSDIMMRSSNNQFFVLLPRVTEETISVVTERILKNWERSENSPGVKIVPETESVDISPEDRKKG